MEQHQWIYVTEKEWRVLVSEAGHGWTAEHCLIYRRPPLWRRVAAWARLRLQHFYATRIDTRMMWDETDHG